MRRRQAWLLGAAALALLLAGLVLAVRSFDGGAEETSPPPAETAPPPAETAPPPDQTVPQTETEPPSEPTPPPAPEPTAPEPTAPPPPTVPFAWTRAGAFVWHETDVDPGLLGRTLRESGFGWVAVLLHDGLAEDPVEADWVYRFRVASGLPVGGWGVLRTDPEREAELAHLLVGRYGLDFYIANAEAEYEFSGVTGPDGERSLRSRRFVESFRSLRPAPFAAGLSSYCRADRHDLDWSSWSRSGFVFLPQAYVNDLGEEGAPATCAAAARGFFRAADVHPTIGVHAGPLGAVDAATYVELLDSADTVGFSVYLAETRMTETDWRTLGAAATERGIAHAG